MRLHVQPLGDVPALPRVEPVVAGHRLECDRGVASGAGYGPEVIQALVEGGGDRREGNQTEGRLQPDRTAVSSGHADRAALVTPEGDVDLTARDRDRRP